MRGSARCRRRPGAWWPASSVLRRMPRPSAPSLPRDRARHGRVRRLPARPRPSGRCGGYAEVHHDRQSALCPHRANQRDGEYGARAHGDGQPPRRGTWGPLQRRFCPATNVPGGPSRSAAARGPRRGGAANGAPDVHNYATEYGQILVDQLPAVDFATYILT